MTEKPKLVPGPWIKGVAFGYMCSICGQAFLPPEDRTPKEAMEELLEAFNEHIHEIHSEAQEPGPEA